jgi:peptidylprolyl isomerase
LTRLNPDLPAALGGAVEKMMALQPEDRFASMAETRDALSALGERAERLRAAPPPPPVPLEPSGDSPWLSFAVVILVLAGLAGLLIRLDHNRPRAEVGHAPPVLPAPTAPPSQSPESTPEASPSPSATPSPSPSDVASPSPVARASSSASPAALLPGIASTGDIVTTDSGLMYQDIKVGEGPIPTPGDTVKVEYTAWLMNGKKVDSTVDRGKPFEFVLGTGQVIKGWDEGVSTMHVGGRRKLIIPASLGYGASGAPPAIPPGATLILDLEVLSTQPPP